MDPVTLFMANGAQIDAHLCGKCKRIWESKHSAERCCTCSFCGGYSDWNGSVTHPECSSKRRVEVETEALLMATLVTDYSGPFLVKDRLYMDVSELLGMFTESELPEFGFCLDEHTPYIDIGDVLDNASVEMHEDWEAEECEEFENGIAAWNKANEDNCSYFECDDRKWSRVEVMRKAKLWND